METRFGPLAESRSALTISPTSIPRSVKTRWAGLTSPGTTTGQASTTSNVYAEWINAGGGLAAPPAGILVSASPWSLGAGSNQTIPVICKDGMGGAIIAYESSQPNTMIDIYAQGLVNLPGFGLAYPAELPVSVAAQNHLYPQIVNDQPGGAVICWEDYSGGVGSDIYAQAVLNGATSWLLNGIPVCPLPTGSQYSPAISFCGANSAIITWQ